MNGYAVRRIRRRARRSIYKGFLVTALIFLIVSVIVMTAKMLSFSISGNLFHQFKSIELPAMLSGTKTADLDHGWNLILVNSKNRIPGDYEAELIQLSNGKQVDERIYPELQEMFDAARADGLHLFVSEGYRTREEQQLLLDEKTEAYEMEGHSKSEAEKLAKPWVAVPGFSEHQLGIAVDINADHAGSTDDEVYTWLAENSWQYGFIKRYPSDKTEITGTINEPWHYRYVGKEAAREIVSQEVCLEEYVEMLE